MRGIRFNGQTISKSTGTGITVPVKFIPSIILFFGWLIVMFRYDLWYLFTEYGYMPVVMMFGSFVAGASAEGGGAVAFPVMTLVYNIPPAVARNFSLAIQSIGMTTAAWLIIRSRFRIEKSYLLPVSMGGVLGMVLGTLYLAPLIPAPYTKMLFVSFWLGFGIVLFIVNHLDKRKVVDSLSGCSRTDTALLVLTGVVGGALSSLLGSGLDIVSFSWVTMRYHLSEKVATPTSVVIMAVNTVVGFLLHVLILQDFNAAAFHYWIICIPVVIIGAPMGAWFISTRSRWFIARLLYVIIVVQFAGAYLILRPKGGLLLFSAAIFGFSLLFFFGFSRMRRNVTDSDQ